MRLGQPISPTQRRDASIVSTQPQESMALHRVLDHDGLSKAALWVCALSVAS